MCKDCSTHEDSFDHDKLPIEDSHSVKIVDSIEKRFCGPILGHKLPLIRKKNTAANEDVDVTADQLDEMERQATYYYSKFLEALGVDWRNDPNSNDTPYRVAKSYLRDMWSGRYTKFDFDKLTKFPNDKKYDQMLVQGPIDIKSMCSHHHREITGYAIVGVLYGKDSNLIGLSKFSRIIKHYSRRGQIQEELTQQLSSKLFEILNPIGIGVIINAKHHCMSHRGVQEPNCYTTTSSLLGIFRDDMSVRNEFLNRSSELEKLYRY